MKTLTHAQDNSIREQIEAMRPKLSMPFACTEHIEFWIDEDRMGLDTGRLGMFDPLTDASTIWLSPLIETAQDLMLSTVVHELRHMWQYQKYGAVGYYLRAIPVLRQFILEPSAIALEKEVDAIMHMDGIRDEDHGSWRVF